MTASKLCGERRVIEDDGERIELYCNLPEGHEGMHRSIFTSPWWIRDGTHCVMYWEVVPDDEPDGEYRVIRTRGEES